MTLQLLIENAFKHNQIDEDTPLNIEILSQNGSLVVKNTLNRKEESSKEEGLGTGLENIRLRYSYYTEEKIAINETETHFEVVLPLIEITEHESINS